jgi:hypothetical protein
VGLSNKPENRGHKREYNARTHNDQISLGTGQSGNLRLSKKNSSTHNLHRTNDTRIGTGQFSNLRTVKQGSSTHPHGSNRMVTGVFVSRFHQKTSSQMIAKHIQREAAISVKPEKLQTRYAEYSSFYIRCDGTDRNDIMDANLWPRGTLIKPYMS